jgi:hypothetical protein
MQVLIKYDKEQLVIKLHQEGKTMPEISSAAHMSFGDIGKIIKKVDGRANDENDIDLDNKSKETKALWLFENGKRPIDVAICLDIPYDEVTDLQQEYWALNQLYELPLAYQELKNDFDSFFELFKLLKENKMLSKQHILKILRYAGHELPLLESKIRKLTSDIIELEIKKKDFYNTIMLQRAQLSDLGQAIIRYQNAIEYKQQQQ